MVSSAIWKKTRTSEFFKDNQRSTSPKDECYLRSMKNSRVRVFFFQIARETVLLLIIINSSDHILLFSVGF